MSPRQATPNRCFVEEVAFTTIDRKATNNGFSTVTLCLTRLLTKSTAIPIKLAAYCSKRKNCFTLAGCRGIDPVIQPPGRQITFKTTSWQRHVHEH